MLKTLILLTIVSNTIFLIDTPDDVPQHYADFISGRFSYNTHTLSVQFHVDRLFQNYSGPIYVFINSDGNDATGWNNTGYISEDEFTLYGADLMLIINKTNPQNSALYQLNNGGGYMFLYMIPSTIAQTTSIRSRVLFSLDNLPGDTISVKLFMNEEGNWGDLFPNTYPVILTNDYNLPNLSRD
jgi:hypothetical protein